MHYIVVDLEWNQPMSFDSSVFRQVGDRLVFEMIQIGAVKVDDKYQVVDSISIPIRPQYYVKIHPRIRKMTQLGAEELADAPTFNDVFVQLQALTLAVHGVVRRGIHAVDVGLRRHQRLEAEHGLFRLHRADAADLRHSAPVLRCQWLS